MVVIEIKWESNCYSIIGQWLGENHWTKYSCI